MDTEDERRRRVLAEGMAQGARPDLAALGSFVPAEWADRAAVGLDGVLRVLPEPAADRLSEEIVGLLEPLVDAFDRRQMSGPAALDALQAAHRLSAAAEAAVLHASRELAARTGEEQLRVKEVADPKELSRTARERWRTRCKSLTATEMSVLTGMGRGTARERVAISLAPEVCRSAVDQALVAGVARMDLVAAWWRRCARMPHEQAGTVARALFATDVSPAEAAVERLTPEGDLSSQPWAKKVFDRALEREALRQEGQDPEAQERNRRAAHERRDAYAVVDDDGTARLVITGDTISVVGCMGRLTDLAARARREGDPRTESELRSDIARSLLLHSVLQLPDLGDEPGLITPHDVEHLVDVLSGAPGHEVQVVVPWDVLTGTAALIGPGSVNPAPPEHPQEAAPPSGQGAVGQVLGRWGHSLSAAQIRRIAGRPGTTFYRILTDPADGRCLERSIAAYAPDAAMRAQLRAADATSRAPGSTTSAAGSQLDHVKEYLVGGATSERNLQTLDVAFHALKTEKFWDAEMDASRTVTWTSFWGRVYRTRPYDYRQLLTWVLGPEDRTTDPGGGASGDHLVDERYLASLLVYAALAQRGHGGRLEADDDDPDSTADSDASIQRLRDAVVLRRSSSGGRQVPGPRRDTPTPEDLLTTDRQEVLDRGDWVEAVAEAAADRDDGDRDGGASEGDRADDPPPPF